MHPIVSSAFLAPAGSAAPRSSGRDAASSGRSQPSAPLATETLRARGAREVAVELAVGGMCGMLVAATSPRGKRSRKRCATARPVWELAVDLPLPDPAELQGAISSFAAVASETAASTASSASAAWPSDQVAALAEAATAALATALKAAPPEVQQEVTQALASVQQAYYAALTPEVQSGLAPVVQPAAAGAALVGLLALRRGPQPWLEELPTQYDPLWIEQYWSRRPLRLLGKFVAVVGGAGSFFLALKLDEALGKAEENEPERAIQARELVTDLGVAFIKLAQVWASRPDILPKAYNEAFEKLLEQVRPFGKEQAFVTLNRNVDDLNGLVDDLAAFEEPIAAASVGQVYKATIKGRPVAVKVQRPDVRDQITLDLYVIRQICKLGLLVPGDNPPISRQSRSTLELLQLAGPAWFEELDYQKEASNQRRFAETVAGCDLIKDNVVVPEVVLARPQVLVQEWLDGKKLTQPGAAKDNAEEVVTLLLNSYMVQFLETGYLHGDPHPGNFVVTPGGKLGILDYGLMTEISPDKRVAFIEYLMHLQAKEYGKCLDDLINLEFFPKGIRTDAEAREILVPALSDTLNTLFGEGGDLRKKRDKMAKKREEAKESGKLDELQKQLRGIAKRYGAFQLPSYFTLILRSFSLLEGLGLRQDSNFNIVGECFPYIARRLLTDDSLRIREALRTYLYMGRGRVAVKRIDDLASGFGTFTNLMKSDRAGMIAGRPEPNGTAIVRASTASQHSEEEAAGAAGQAAATNTVVLDSAMRDIAEVVFSPDGNFLQDILIDEGVAAVDALSRTVLLRLLRTMGPFALPITLPLSLLFGTGANGDRLLARQDKEALLVLRRITELLQPEEVAESQTRGGDVALAARDLQRLQPLATGLLPTVTPGASAFAQRFAQQLAKRILVRLAEDIEQRAGLRPGMVTSS